ncbi:hypothetical protein D6C93_08942, partial [Aureobasidium pullulans]
INTQPKGITTLYLVYLSHCNIPRLLHSPRHDSALQGRAVGTSTKAAWLPSVSAERLPSHIPRESVCRAGCLHPERPSQYGRAVWAALRTPAMCYTRSFGVEDFLASLLNMREATCQCLEHSSNLSTHTYSTVVFLQPHSPIRVLSLSYILDQITSTRSKNSNCTYPANVSMSMRFQVWISSVPSLASVSGKLCEDSSCRLQRTRTVSAHIISRRIQPTLRGVLHFCMCGLVGSRPLWSCISPRESPITGGVVLKG